MRLALAAVLLLGPVSAAFAAEPDTSQAPPRAKKESRLAAPT